MLDESLQGLGGQLHRWRLAYQPRKLSQGQVASQAGLSVPTVRLLEHDKGLVRSFLLVLDAFNMTLAGRSLPSCDHIGQSVALLRKRRGINQRQFAVMLDVCQDTVIDLERSQGHLATLSKALVMLGAGVYLAPRGQIKAFFTHAGNSSGQNLWTTPGWLIERLIEVFGRFDLDPCAATRSPTTRAKTVFLPEDDGLALPWFGKVFVNPPYSRELPLWIHKIVVEVQACRVALVIALIPVRTDTKWWHEAIASGATAVFLKGRLKFGNSEQSAPFPSALLVWGVSVEEMSKLKCFFPDALI